MLVKLYSSVRFLFSGLNLSLVRKRYVIYETRMAASKDKQDPNTQKENKIKRTLI